jgi:uncharacterized protein (DUF4415 family)
MSIRPYERPVPVTTKWQIVRAVRTDDGRVPIEQPDGSFRPARGQADWARVDRMTEADLKHAIAADPDDPGNDPSCWENTAPVSPRRKEQVTVRLDADMLNWFRQQGRGYQTRINAVLRGFYEAHRRG